MRYLILMELGFYEKLRWEGSSLVVQWVKDLVLPQVWQRMQLQPGSVVWPKNFHMPCLHPPPNEVGRKYFTEIGKISKLYYTSLLN